MSWQTILARAVAALRQEESELARDLAAIRERIAGLAGAAGGGRKPRRKRTLSAKARAAISRAQRKRWAAFRAKASASR
jgi:hypothetical protein